MARTIRNIVEQLLSEGFDINYYVRKDGGILIKEINGQKFIGAEGNKIAREMVGETLSERREVQLQSATSKRKSFVEEYGREAYNQYRRITAKWRKANLPKSAGKITMKKFREVIKEKGLKKALEFLTEKDKYASGIAYAKNVEILAYYIQDLGNKLNEDYPSLADEYYNLASDLLINEDRIREHDIPEAYRQLYRLIDEPLTEALISEVARNTRRILGL